MRNLKNKNHFDRDNLPEKITISPRAHDLTGRQFHYLTALYPCGRNNDKRIEWLCRCKCGQYLKVSGKSLSRGNTKSCGCYHKQRAIESNERRSDITIGEKYGKLTIVSFEEYRLQNNGKRSRYWRCSCECGGEIVVRHDYLKNGDTQSCGCLSSQGELTIKNLLDEHGVPYEREYSFPDLVHKLPLRFDFAIFDMTGELVQLIEFQGEQHTDPNNGFYSEDLIRNDKMKLEYCKRNNIKCTYIYYNRRVSPKWGDLQINLKEIFKEEMIDELI